MLFLGSFALLNLFPLPPGSHVLEIGSNPYFFHILLRRLFPYAEIAGTNFFDHNIFAAEVSSLTQSMVSSQFVEEYKFESMLADIEAVSLVTLPSRQFRSGLLLRDLGTSGYRPFIRIPENSSGHPPWRTSHRHIAKCCSFDQSSADIRGIQLLRRLFNERYTWPSQPGVHTRRASPSSSN